MEKANHPGKLVDHLFRHEAGKMIAVLSHVFGVHHLQLAEDVVQEAFLKAAQAWSFNGIPENPSAWLMKVAKNKAVDILRRQNSLEKYVTGSLIISATNSEQHIEEFFLDTEISDSQLRMIFACCHPALSEEDQIALTLKVISGFSAAEIARALLTNEAVIQKRIFRARELLRREGVQLGIPSGNELGQRLETVYTILYLLFNEGYHSSKPDELIRQDLCAEAGRLLLLVNSHKLTRRPQGSALLALMCFHAARFESRMDEGHSIVLLHKQDRSRWNRDLINRGLLYLNESSAGTGLTVYHLEAAIAAEHCLAPGFEQTSWMRLLQLYDLLLEQKSTSVVQLNRAVVLAQLGHVEDAINYIIQNEKMDRLLQTNYLYPAVLGDLYLRKGEKEKAIQYLQAALELNPSHAEKKLIIEKLKRCT
jgi:RNA polymerase sigma-70 factor (ECF subfamily)